MAQARAKPAPARREKATTPARVKRPAPPKPAQAPKPPRPARKAPERPGEKAKGTKSRAPARKTAVHAAAASAAPASDAKWVKMLASWYTGAGGGSCGTLQDGHLHFAELGVAGDYGHGVGRGRGNMAIDLGLPGQLPCGAAGWVRYKGRTTYASKADVGYGNTSLPPNAKNQRRMDLYENLAHYLHFSGVDVIEFAPNFKTHTGGTVSTPVKREWANPLEHAKVTPERIDQGVDYAGTGYLVAVTHAIVTNVSTGRSTGWPGNFVEYQITTPGQLKGAYIYYAEGVTPNVRRGQVLAPGEKVATLIPGWSTGIECGFGAGDGTLTYYGYHDGAYHDGDATRAGIAYDVLVRRLGGPGGIIEGKLAGKYPEYMAGGTLGGEITSQTLQGVTPSNSLGPGVQHETASGEDWGAYVKRNWRNIDDGAKSGAGYAGAAREFAVSHKYVTKSK